MNQIVYQLKESPRAKAYLLLALCFLVTLILITQSGNDNADEKSQTESTNQPITNQDHPKLRNSNSRYTDDMLGRAVPGGLGGVRDKDSAIEEIVANIKPTLEERSKLKFDSLEVLNYKHQIVAGINYFVKAKAKVTGGDEKIVHLRIFKNLKQELELTAFQMDKQEIDEIVYFQ